MEHQLVGPDEYKRALRNFTSGVTVVTVADGDEQHGMTATAFASVSLDPPLILVCLEKTSNTRVFVLNSERFVVNFLTAGQEQIARAFAAPGRKPFDSIAHTRAPGGAAILDGALAWLDCSVTHVVDGGDHDVVIAAVEACDASEGEPLVYYQQHYRALHTT